MREYVVTLYNYEDLESFYDDMETPGGSFHIPERAIPVKERRPISRNTHYMLTDEEAELIRQDPRVMAVELTPEEQGLVLRRLWTQSSSNWNKSNVISNTYLNWGILRCVEGVQRSNWGSDGVTSVTGSVSVNASGKNVDVVIVDGHINPAHPEFAVNSDGSGGSRVIQYNWFELNPAVRGTAAGTYVYTPYVDGGDPFLTDDNDHGAHVAGTVCGNTYGWARDANIYNFSPYGTSPSYSGLFTMDYIREWHRTKPINPSTGRKNPTITNHSYGYGYNTTATSVTAVRFNGVTINGPFTNNDLLNYGIYVSGTQIINPARNTSYEQDLIDAMADGIICVGAAGNEYVRIDNTSTNASEYYNNYFVVPPFGYYYGRGTITAAGFTNTNKVICVGAIGTSTNEVKRLSSNCGPRIDLYAPGSFIMSSVNSTVGVTVADTRNSSYRLAKYSGTSMASPQVAGVLACLAEVWPTMTQEQARNYIIQKATTNQITDGTGGPSDFSDLQGSENRYLYYYKERPDTGQVSPKLNQGLRPASGLVYPRPKIYRYGR